MSTIQQHIDAAIRAAETERNAAHRELKRIAPGTLRVRELTDLVEKLRRVKRELEQAWHELRR